VDEFKDALRQSTLCVDVDGDGDDYNYVVCLASVITAIADRFELMRTVTCRRASDVWFDDE